MAEENEELEDRIELGFGKTGSMRYYTILFSKDSEPTLTGGYGLMPLSDLETALLLARDRQHKIMMQAQAAEFQRLQMGVQVPPVGLGGQARGLRNTNLPSELETL